MRHSPERSRPASLPRSGRRRQLSTAEDLAFWDRHGYLVLHDAAPAQQCRAAAEAIYDFLGVDPSNPATWYSNPAGHTIWVSLLRHPAFQANRESPRIHAAFAQLWGRADLWPSIDHGGFNPPERPGWPFPGPRLHWDVSIAQPVPFGLQGILYLTDTAADQGAFQCVPGFHSRLAGWLADLPPGADPRDHTILDTLPAHPVARPRPRPGDLASRPAARRQSQPFDAPAGRAIPHHASEPLGRQSRLALTRGGSIIRL